jgi:methylglutaconyl-CoA hydratase
MIFLSISPFFRVNLTNFSVFYLKETFGYLWYEKIAMMNVYTEIKGHTAHIFFSNPPVNALPSSVLTDLQVHLNAAGNREDIRAVVLRSEGRTFCAGASFDELITLNDYDTAKAFFMGFGKVILAMRSLPKPVIVRIQGKTVGGGLGIVAAGDLAIATEAAAFKLSELSIGIGPYVIAPAIIRKTGIGFFQQMSFQPWRWFSAFDALKAGLLTHVTESEGRMDELIDEIVSAYGKYDAAAVAFLKNEVWHDTQDWEQLLEKQAEKSASLLLRESTKSLLSEIKNRK